MNIKFAVILLFAYIAACHASFGIILTYPGTTCSYENVTAVFATNDPGACMTKRSVSQLGECVPTKGGFSYNQYYGFCSNDTVPTFPADWQVLLLSTDSACNATSDQAIISFLAAPKSFGPTWVATIVAGGINIANTTFGCDTASGNMSVTACSDGSASPCVNFNLESNVCSIDGSSQFFGKQSTCVAPPVSVPETPVASPVAAPVATPTTTTPVKAPAKASSASIFSISAASLLTFVALL